ncbi:MAG: hypothetical protein ACJAYU_004757 [Bradymonadia bacterium]|jgi:hypothetical protein
MRALSLGIERNPLTQRIMNIVIAALTTAFAILNVAAAPGVATYEDVQVPTEFTIQLEIDGATEGGFVAGHPGRASITVDGDEVVFTMGGDEAIANIYRESTSIRLPIHGAARVSASYDNTGAMVLVVEQGHRSALTVGIFDPAGLVQLSMMEELVGGVSCSNNFYVGAAADACGVQVFDGTVSNVSISSNSQVERVAAR